MIRREKGRGAPTGRDAKEGTKKYEITSLVGKESKKKNHKNNNKRENRKKGARNRFSFH